MSKNQQLIMLFAIAIAIVVIGMSLIPRDKGYTSVTCLVDNAPVSCEGVTTTTKENIHTELLIGEDIHLTIITEKD